MTLNDAIVRYLRAWRATHGVTQDELGRRARERGLKWNQITLAHIETKRRRLSAVEVFLLPNILNVSLADMCKEAGIVNVGGHEIEAEKVGELLNGTTPLPVIQNATLAAEQRFARNLGLTIDELTSLAHSLWGRGMVDERDRRFNELPTSTIFDLRALKGHVTRSLILEIEAHRTNMTVSHIPPLTSIDGGDLRS